MSADGGRKESKQVQWECRFCGATCETFYTDDAIGMAMRQSKGKDAPCDQCPRPEPSLPTRIGGPPGLERSRHVGQHDECDPCDEFVRRQPGKQYTDCGGLPDHCGGTCDGCIERAESGLQGDPQRRAADELVKHSEALGLYDDTPEKLVEGHSLGGTPETGLGVGSQSGLPGDVTEGLQDGEVTQGLHPQSPFPACDGNHARMEQTIARLYGERDALRATLHGFWKWADPDEYCDTNPLTITGKECDNPECSWCPLHREATRLLKEAGLVSE